MRKIINIILLLSVNSLIFAQTPGVIGNSQTICYGSGPADLVFTTPPTGGQSPLDYRWRQSFNGTSFTDISGRGAGRETYSPPVLGRTTYFQCRVTDANNVVLGTTNTVQITVRTPLSPGRISADPTAEAGVTPDPVTEIEAASGGGAEPAFQWQNSADGVYWSDLQGATSTTYSPPPLISDTWYRRMAINGNCGTTASNSVSISVHPISVYTTEVPLSYPTHEVWDLGTEFLALTDGVVSRIRLYTNESEGGVHTIRFWRATGFRLANELLAGPLSWNISAGTAGWREYALPSPVQIISGQAYIVTITMEDINNISSEINNFTPAATNNYIQFVRGRIATTPGNDHLEYSTTGYFRDVVFIPFSPGTVGNAQSVCYNTAPSALVSLTIPTGGAGSYNYQWQSSTDSNTWSNIQGATSAGYSPTPLVATTYFRRAVISSTLTVYSTPVLITVNPQFNSAHFQGTAQIFANTSTFFRAAITGGTPPYRIEYTRNGVSQPPIVDYNSGNDIFTGILNGTYTYAITNVTDALNCQAQDISGNITITATGSYSGTVTNKVLVLTNSSSSSYIDFNFLIRPYLDWFGIPYDLINISTDALPVLNNYALIMFGHRNVYHTNYPAGQQNYPTGALEIAISGGVGLYSFDPHLFDVACAFNLLGAAHPQVTSSVININTSHYITELHVNDTYNTTNNVFTLRDFGGQMTTTVPATSFNLTGDTYVNNLVTITSGGNTEPLSQAADFGNGRIVKWSAYDWMMHEKVGPIKGMDDLIWRGIVWAARKPFAMEGLPPMITMRVDDVDGSGINVANNFEWINICNEYGLIPWCGTFNNSIPIQYIPTLRNLINNGLATASPHAFGDNSFIYYNLNNDPVFSASDNVIAARNFFINNQLTMSNYMVPHFYLISSEGLTEIRNMGIEFIGTKIPFNPSPYPGESLALGPYKKNWTEWGGPGKPYFYADSVNWLGNPFFISLTEIGDDGNYEWYPNIGTTQEVIARGVRHLRRALNGMFLPTLFTHEYNLLVNIPAATWRVMISGVTGAITSYNPEYRSMDYAVKYVRAKDNLRITNFTENDNMVYVTVTGVNDMETRCYIFTESGGQISSEMVTLPRVTNSAAQVSVGFLK